MAWVIDKQEWQNMYQGRRRVPWHAKGTLLEGVAVVSRYVLPTIHKNGTKKDDLINDTCKVLNCLRDADQQFTRNTPHGRDYPNYNKTGTHKDACNQWFTWQGRLRDLITEINEYVDFLACEEE